MLLLLFAGAQAPAPAPAPPAGGGGKLRRRPQPQPLPSRTPPLELQFGTAWAYAFGLSPSLTVTNRPRRAVVHAASPHLAADVELDSSNLRLLVATPVEEDTRLSVEAVWAAARMSTGRPPHRATGRPN